MADDIFADFQPVAAAVRAGDRKQGFGAGAKDKKQDEADKLKKEEEAEKKKAEAEEAAEAERLKLEELPNYDAEVDIDLKGMRSPKIRHNLGLLLNSEKFSDVTFIVGAEKKKFFGHKLVLAARSPVFAAMLFSKFAESSMREIELADIKPTIFMSLLTSMYTDRCDATALDAGTAIEVLMAAKRYQIEALSKRVVKFIKLGVSIHNACELFGTKVGLMDEEEGALGFIEDNCSEIVKTRGWQNLPRDHVKIVLRSNKLSIDESDLFKGVLAWGRAEVERQKRDIAEKKLIARAVEQSLKDAADGVMPPGVAKAIAASLKDKAVADADADLKAALDASAAHAAGAAPAADAAAAKPNDAAPAGEPVKPAPVAAATPVVAPVLDAKAAELKAAQEKTVAEAKLLVDPELKDVVADLIKLIRFPIMDLESFAAVVPTSGVMPADHQLAIFKLLTDKEKEKNPPKEPWNCASCTYANGKEAEKCVMCASARPPYVPGKKTTPSKPWVCPACTYHNGAQRVRCEVCNEKMPVEKENPKEDRVNAAVWYISVPREPRRADARRMRFLIWGGCARNEVDDVRLCIEEAFVAQYKKKSKDFVVDVADNTTLLNIGQLSTYDAVLSWWGTVAYLGGTAEVLAEYADMGGGVVVAMFGCSQSGMQGRFSNEAYWPIQVGQQSNAQNLSLDTKSVLDKNNKPAKPRGGGGDDFDNKSKAAVSDHPLMTNVRSFQGGTQSYHAAIRVRDAKTCKIVAAWSNGQPLVVEGPMPVKKKAGAGSKQAKCVVLNFYPITSRCGAGNWQINTDGGHLMLNALTYTANSGFLKRAKPTDKNKVPYAKGVAAVAAGGFGAPLNLFG